VNEEQKQTIRDHAPSMSVARRLLVQLEELSEEELQEFLARLKEKYPGRKS
jgi:hypothetical protein